MHTAHHADSVLSCATLNHNMSVFFNRRLCLQICQAGLLDYALFMEPSRESVMMSQSSHGTMSLEQTFVPGSLQSL